MDPSQSIYPIRVCATCHSCSNFSGCGTEGATWESTHNGTLIDENTILAVRLIIQVIILDQVLPDRKSVSWKVYYHGVC